MSSATDVHRKSMLLQVATIALLVVMTILLHAFAPAVDPALDPTAMLALGFVILVSFTFGGVVEAVKLPHITGYILAGLILGPSVAERLPSLLSFVGVSEVPAPFDRGVLNHVVIDHLSLFDALAVALIALTAGGEMKIDIVRRGIRLVARIMVRQALAMAVIIGSFALAVLGLVPEITLPGLQNLPLAATIALAAVVAAVSLSGSPAATIAVINETRAEGDVTRTTLNTVILTDVVVLIGFAIASLFAARALGVEEESGNLVAYLSAHIFGSVLAGLALGLVMALYLRYVGKELLLFVVGTVYGATLVAQRLHLDPLLLFLAAGFTVGNFSKSGDHLVHAVERLSVPVYVVFFTLAGARLHLTELATVLPYALALCFGRAASMWFGVATGYREGIDPPAVRRYGYLGFISQAGVVIGLTQIVANRLGEPGEIIGTLLMGGLAINEVFGPALFKAALGFAGEIGKAKVSVEGSDPGLPPPEAEAPPDRATRLRNSLPEASRASLPPGRLSTPRAADPGPADPWGPPCRTNTEALDTKVLELEAELQVLVRDVTRGPIQELRDSAELFLRELRREFLRHHRRAAVDARARPSAAEFAASLGGQQAELAEKWRGIVLARAHRVGQSGFSPERLIEAVDDVVDSLPEVIPSAYEDATFEPHDDDDMVLAFRRAGLRGRRALQRSIGSTLAPRDVALRSLARYHLSGAVPGRLEGLAAVFVQAEHQLASRTRGVFEAIVSGYEGLAQRLDDPEVDLEKALIVLRQQVEQEMTLALDELRRMARDATRRTAQILGAGLIGIKEDVLIYDTLDLPPRRRRTSHVFKHRVKGITHLTQSVESLRTSSSANYAMLAMELELIGFETRVKDALREHLTRLESEVSRRGVSQLDKVETALAEARTSLARLLADGAPPQALSAALRAMIDAIAKVAEDSARVMTGYAEELLDERKVAPIIDALMHSAATLSDTYRVPAGRQRRAEWQLPVAVSTVDVDVREHVSHYLDQHVAPLVLAATRELAEKAGPVASVLGELERLIAFNVEVAVAELDVVTEETIPEDTASLVRDMVIGQLDRSHTQVKGFAEESRRWPTELGASMRSAAFGALTSLRGSFLDSDLSTTSIGAMKRAARFGRALTAIGRLPSTLRASRTRVAELGRALAGGEKRSAQLRRSLGLPERTVHAPLEPALFAPAAPTVELPMVYRRLFAPDTLEAVDVHAGRERDIEQAIRVLAKESGGKLRTVALVGIDGVGKSAVAAAIVRGRRWKSIRRVSFSEPQTPEDIDALFREGVDGQLVVVDGLCWLNGMYPGGFEPLRRFIDGVIRDGSRRAYLVNIDALVYRAATSASAIAEAFPTVIRLEPLTVDELKTAVIARHEMSGFGHAFDAAVTSGGLARFVDRIGVRFRRPYDRYFEELHAASGGLVRDALRLWLASIREIEDKNLIVIGPVPRSPIEALERLPEPLLLELYGVARQGWSDARTHAHVFRTSESIARAQLTRLAHLGLVTETRGVYRVAPHLRGALARLLHGRGWIP